MFTTIIVQPIFNLLVLIYGLLLAHELGIDPANAIAEKLTKNDAKYPVEKAKGRNVKYTEL